MHAIETLSQGRPGNKATCIKFPNRVCYRSSDTMNMEICQEELQMVTQCELPSYKPRFKSTSPHVHMAQNTRFVPMDLSVFADSADTIVRKLFRHTRKSGQFLTFGVSENRDTGRSKLNLCNILIPDKSFRRALSSVTTFQLRVQYMLKLHLFSPIQTSIGQKMQRHSPLVLHQYKNICVKTIQWGKLWYNTPVVIRSHSGERAVSFKKIILRNH